jgi:hypothetical protein
MIICALSMSPARSRTTSPALSPQQKPHPGHHPIAVADARSALDEVQLETQHLVGRRCIGERFSQAANRLQLEMWAR